MIVWVVEGGWDNDTSSILGVFNSLDKAKDCQWHYKNNPSMEYDFILINEHEVQ